VHLCDAASEEVIATLKGFTGQVMTLAAATYSGDIPGVKLWQPATGHELATLVHDAAARQLAVAFDPAGHRLAVGDGKGNVWIWDGRPRTPLPEPGQLERGP